MSDVKKKVLMLTKIRELEVRKRTDESLKRSEITLGGYVSGLGFQFGEVEALCEEMQDSGWVKVGRKTLGGSRGNSKRTVKLTASGRNYLETALAPDNSVAASDSMASNEEVLSALAVLATSDGKLEIIRGDKVADQLTSSEYYVKTNTGYSELKIHESVMAQLIEDCYLVKESEDVYKLILEPKKETATIEPKAPKGIEQIQWWMSESRKHPKQVILYLILAIGGAIGIKQFILPSLPFGQEQEPLLNSELSVVVLNYSANMNLSKTVMAGLQESIKREHSIKNVQLEEKTGTNANYNHTGKYYYENDEVAYEKLRDYIQEELRVSGCNIKGLGNLQLDPVKYNAPLGKVEYWLNDECDGS